MCRIDLISISLQYLVPVVSSVYAPNLEDFENVKLGKSAPVVHGLH